MPRLRTARRSARPDPGRSEVLPASRQPRAQPVGGTPSRWAAPGSDRLERPGVSPHRQLLGGASTRRASRTSNRSSTRTTTCPLSRGPTDGSSGVGSPCPPGFARDRPHAALPCARDAPDGQYEMLGDTEATLLRCLSGHVGRVRRDAGSVGPKPPAMMVLSGRLPVRPVRLGRGPRLSPTRSFLSVRWGRATDRPWPRRPGSLTLYG